MSAKAKGKKFTSESTIGEIARHYGVELAIMEQAIEKGVEEGRKDLQREINEVVLNQIYTLSDDKEMLELIKKQLKKEITKNLPALIDKVMKRTIIYCEEP
jgi:uncharacterized protein (DUF885 family)